MAQYASLNGLQAVKASLTLAYYGIAVADVDLAQTGTISSPCSLVIGNLTCSMTVFRENTFAGVRSLRLVGGAGGWRKLVPAQAYANPIGIRLSTVMGDVCSLVGETINIPKANDAIIGTNFVRENAQAQRMLRQLVGTLWWMDLTGTTQIVPRPTTRIQSSFLAGTYTPGAGRLTVSTEDPISWQPGNTFVDANFQNTLTISSATFSSDSKGAMRVEVLTT